MECSKVVSDYINMVIKNSWTWEKLTKEEKERFMNMEIFNSISGRESVQKRWVHTIYRSFLVALGYTPIRWRE